MTSLRQPSRLQARPGGDPGVLTPTACVPGGPGLLQSKKLHRLNSQLGSYCLNHEARCALPYRAVWMSGCGCGWGIQKWELGTFFHPSFVLPLLPLNPPSLPPPQSFTEPKEEAGKRLELQLTMKRKTFDSTILQLSRAEAEGPARHAPSPPQPFSC